MLTFFGKDLLDVCWESATVCIGVFDGVHLGHLAVIQRAVEKARENEEPCVLVTFDRHPAATLAPDRVPPTIACLGQNLERFERAGVDASVVLPFDHETAATTARDFFQETLLVRLHAARIVVGHDFAFGKDRVGTPDWLSRLIPTTVIEPFELEGHRVSSSEIRRLVSRGEVEHASKLLGHFFTLRGIVQHGQKLGRKLGFPTINLGTPSKQLLPADGIYAGMASTPHGKFGAAISVGFRPTVDGTSRTVEAYLLDYPGQEIYGRCVDLFLSHWIRPEEKFEGLDALTKKIKDDVSRARECLALLEPLSQ